MPTPAPFPTLKSCTGDLNKTQPIWMRSNLCSMYLARGGASCDLIGDFLAPSVALYFFVMQGRCWIGSTERNSSNKAPRDEETDI